MSTPPADRAASTPVESARVDEPITRENQWTCRICGRNFVVANLARDCEKRCVA